MPIIAKTEAEPKSKPVSPASAFLDNQRYQNMLVVVKDALSTYCLNAAYLEGSRVCEAEPLKLLQRDPAINKRKGIEVCNYFGATKNDEPCGYGIMVLRMKTEEKEGAELVSIVKDE
jgi:hypothetical protein